VSCCGPRWTWSRSSGSAISPTWPLPAWLWLPFVALAFDHLGSRLATGILAIYCIAFDIAAFIDGISGILALSFTALAVFCARISKLRFDIMRDMLLSSDRQRLELARANSLVREAHQRVTREIEARHLVEIELRQSQKLKTRTRADA
jgi:hypothetical protein